LAEIAIKLEEHYKKPQDIEFAIEGEEIYIVQTRPITTLKSRFSEVKEIKGEIILKGLAASPGIASGKIKIVGSMADLGKVNPGDILVTKNDESRYGRDNAKSGCDCYGRGGPNSSCINSLS